VFAKILFSSVVLSEWHHRIKMYYPKKVVQKTSKKEEKLIISGFEPKPMHKNVAIQSPTTLPENYLQNCCAFNNTYSTFVSTPICVTQALRLTLAYP